MQKFKKRGKYLRKIEIQSMRRIFFDEPIELN